MGNNANTDMFVRQWQKPTLETNNKNVLCNEQLLGCLLTMSTHVQNRGTEYVERNLTHPKQHALRTTA